MAESIGKQLKQARLKRGLSVEDIAHETRIPIARLHDLENDNYADFPSPTYARSFLTIYSEFLEVDASEFMEALKGPNSPLTLGRNFVPPALNLDSDTTIPIYKRQEQPKEGSPIMTLTVLILLIVIIPTIFFIGKLQSENEATAVAPPTEETPASDEMGGPAVIDPSLEPGNGALPEAPPPVVARRMETGGQEEPVSVVEPDDQFSKPLVPPPPVEEPARDPELDALVNRGSPNGRPVAPAPPEQTPAPAENDTPPAAPEEPAPIVPRARPIEEPGRNTGSRQQEPIPRAIPFRPNR